MPLTDDRHERAVSMGLIGLFGVIAVLAALDLAGDIEEGAGSWHNGVEGTVGLIGAFGVAWMLVRLRGLHRRARSAEDRAGVAEGRAGDLEQRLEVSTQEAGRWRNEAAELVAGLGAAIDAQLDRWGLSAAEKDVALLLLKGLSHKEVADVRGVGEATVRQQARALYKKAGLSGRSDLAAFFLEDLLAARPPREERSDQG